MRSFEPPLGPSGESSIEAVALDPTSRDDIPQLLRGLQYLYMTESCRVEVLQILDEMIPEEVDRTTGRPGMVLWRILVMGVLRLNLNWDYDRLCEMVNEHRTIRQMLGHGLEDDRERYHVQTLKDNVSLLTPEIVDRINQVVVQAGHLLDKKKGKAQKALEETGEEALLRGRCDSFVVETDVHYPTDITLLWDALRKLIIGCGRLSRHVGLSGWGKYRYNLRQVQRLLRQVQRLKASRSSDEQKQAAQDEKIRHAYRKYLDLASSLVERAEETLRQRVTNEEAAVEREEIAGFVAHAHRQIDQIERRVLQGEKIPHAEKVFSLFEPHTEWINKGKAGVPVELGLNTCILEDQYGYILHHRVMEGETDEAIAVAMVEETQVRFPGLKQCSFDEGFYTPANQADLRRLLAVSVLPQKGRLSPEEEAFESSEVFVAARRQHAAVESAINALEVHGLDRCPDHGLDGFKRYVALAVLARNLQQLGARLKKKKVRVATRCREKAA
tara:strand:+ start:1397 stop:2896 length:1500 start_codon:yes stop_codon:yes gene_type:complete